MNNVKKKKQGSKAEEPYTQENPEKVWKPNGPKRIYTNTRNGNRRGKGKNDTRSRRGDTQPNFAGSNDVRWYARTDELLSNVGRLSFNYPAGTDIPYLLGKEAGYANLHSGGGVWINPGVMAIGMIPTYGINDSNASPINVAFKQVYNRIRMENSGARNYDHTDLGKYFIGVDSLFMFYAWMLRGYGLLNQFSFHNKYLPKALVFASGMDYDDLVLNAPNYLNYINNFAKRLTAYMAPKDMPIFERHFTMFTSVYKDSESPRSQFYLYTPTYVNMYKATAEPGHELFDHVYLANPVSAEHNSPGLKFSQIVDIGDHLLSAMDDEDMITMAGDILKAYGEEGVWKQAVITPEFAVSPIFDFTWLTQVQNLTSTNQNGSGATVTDGVMDPYTGSNPGYTIKEIIPSNAASPYITTSMTFAGGTGPMLAHKKLLSSPFTDPTPGDVMESTRLLVAGTSEYSTTLNKWTNTVTDCGSEIVVSVHVINYLGVGSTVELARRPIVTELYKETGVTENTLTTYLNLLEMDNFAMHPIIYYTVHAANASDINQCTLQVPFVDLDNYATIGLSELHNLHTEALLSLLFSGNVGGNRTI